MSMAWIRPLSKIEFFSLTVREYLFFAATLILATGFIHFDVHAVYFAHLGLPLPISGSFGGSPPKLYVTEIYILVLAVLSLAHKNSIAQIKKLFQPRLLSGILFLLIAVGFARALSDFRGESMLVIRNLAFVWYLAIPILIFTGDYSLKLLETIAATIIAVGVAYFLLVPVIAFTQGAITHYWIAFLGVYGVLLVVFFAQKKSLSLIAMLIIGFGIGLGYSLGFQRTNLLGLIVLCGILFLCAQKKLNWLARMLSFAAVIFLFCVVFKSLFVWQVTTSSGREMLTSFKETTLGGNKFRVEHGIRTAYSNPFQKAESNSHGLEAFRTQLWADAFQLFLSRPLVGIGFRDQVVYRLVGRVDPVTGNVYVPNNGYAWGYASSSGKPVSGPHNSYLNALARMGIIGLLFIVLHLWVSIALFRNGYFALFCLAYAQIVYAVFNVGLEGPVRSFFLLLAIGAGLKLILDSPKVARD